MRGVLDRRRLRRNLRLIALDGSAFSLMVGAGETYLPAFALFVGLSALDAGLVATLPMLCGALLGLATPPAVRALSSNRRWVVAAALVQASAFVPLALSAWRGTAPAWLVYGAATAYWAGGLSTGPAWNTWIGDVVPGPLRARYFGRRARLVQASVLAGLIGAGVLLQLAATAHRGAEAFALLFALAGLARMLSAALLRATDEPPHDPGKSRQVGLGELVQRLRHGPDGRLFLYLVLLQCAVNVASPYFTPFMLRDLGLGYFLFMTITATTYISKIAISPRLGEIARRIGTTPLLVVGGVGIAVVPLLWLVSTATPWLLFAQCLSGLAWASHELAATLLFLDVIRPDERTSLLTLFNVANAAAFSVGALLGSFLLTLFGLDHRAYLLVFLVSGLARIAVVPFVRGAGATVPTRGLETAPTRVLALRPTSGPIERPIVFARESHEDRPAAPPTAPDA